MVIEFWKTLTEGPVGFKIREEMSGTHRFTEESQMDGTHPMRFEAEWGPSSLREWLNPSGEKFLRHPMTGIVSVGGLCLDEEFSGFMALKYFEDASIRYEFTFEVNGTNYRYVGEKTNLRPWNLHRTHTTLNGTLTVRDSETVISESTLYFKLNSLPSMLGSFRLT